MKTLLAAALLAAGAPAVAQSVKATDDAGQTIALPRPAQRVISLAPHLTELAFAAGGGAAVVGVMRYSDYPEAATRLPVVGDAFALNFEAIAKLKPDLVLVWGSGLNDRQKTQLRALGLPVFESEIRDVEGIARTLRTLGTLMGTSPAAELVAREVERQWTGLRTMYAQRRPVRVFFQLWREPLMTVNREHVISRAIEACGGRNVFAQLSALTPTVSWEAAVQSNPQLLVTAGSKVEPADFGRWREFKQVEAVKRQRLAVVDGNLLGRMGPRFVQGAAQMCEAIDASR
ncbi:MAG TPA: cobalamin-binding protein [Burkholderiaceae bacterium]|nr:cobalamin-binding protein [Burkholderiaceae bacterium]